MPLSEEELLGKIIALLNESDESLIKEIAPLLDSTESPLYPPDEYQTVNEKSAYLQQKNDKVLLRIREICTKYDRKRLLFCTRKMPFVYVNTLNKHVALESDDITDYIFFENAIILATNAILHFSPPNPNSTIDYTQFIPDSFRLIVLCLIRFTLNSAHLGLRIYNDEDYTILTELNKQEVRRPFIWPAGDIVPVKDKNSILILLPASLAPEEATLKAKYMDKEKLDDFPLINYIPFFADADEFIAQYKWLNDVKFQEEHGISFNKYCEYFYCLNKFIISKLIFKDNEQKIAIKQTSDVYKFASLNRLAGSGLLEIKEKELYQHFKKNFNRDGLTLKEYKAVIESLTIGERDLSQIDIDVLEKPYVFYRFDRKYLVWDFHQNAIIWKSFSRQATDGGIEGNIKGTGFENYVYQKLKQLEGIEELKRNVIIYSKHHLKLMDIDIGFVHRGVLYLVELKSYGKKKGEISGRFYKGNRLTMRLKKYDGLLAEHREKIYSDWKGCSFNKAVYVLITSDIQFIEVKNESLWLLWGSIPRICLLDEFMLYLRWINSPEAE